LYGKFQNKYRIPSARLQTWDYGKNGAYFITICTKNLEHYFGKIADGEIKLSEIGKIAEQYWLEIPNHFSFIELGIFVVMPNHVHRILIIDKLDTNYSVGDVETQLIASLPFPTRETPFPLHETPFPTTKTPTTKTIGGFAGNKNPMINKNISRTIRWYKGYCSFEIRKINFNFTWQSRFHDHIIRNKESFERIQKYIANNPSNWKEDNFY